LLTQSKIFLLQRQD